MLTFTQWVNAYANDDQRLVRFYFQRFRPEFKPAMRAWVATHPLKNPAAPPTPFAMPQYKLAEAEKAKELLATADSEGAAARQSNQRSDNYVLAVVLFAAALFFAGISTKLRGSGHRTALLALGYLLFFGTLIWVITFPVTVAV